MSDRDRFRLIGDPHITRKFRLGVPIDRRGEREDHLFNDFASRLCIGIEPTLIMVGDLLEKPTCSLEDLYRIYRILEAASQVMPERQFYMMAGNHDISPDTSSTSAFMILKAAFDPIPNVHFITEPTVHDGIAMFPWDWHKTATEQLEDVRGQLFDTAVGHWDLMSYDEDHTDHLCPASELEAMGVTKIYSGHWHIPGDYTVDGVTVHCTGSMQPMTHAEDPDGLMYVTVDYKDYINARSDEYEDKYVRVVADKGVEIEPPESCLGFKVKRNVDEEDQLGSVEIEEFSVDSVLSRSFTKHNVPDEVRDFIKDRLDVTA